MLEQFIISGITATLVICSPGIALLVLRPVVKIIDKEVKINQKRKARRIALNNVVKGV